MLPSFSVVRDVQKQLAAHPRLSLGVRCTTPFAWAQECWEVWGDGRSIVSAAQRAALVRLMLHEEATATDNPTYDTDGMARALCSFIDDCAPWIASMKKHEREASRKLAYEEEQFIELAHRYLQELEQRNFIEMSEVLHTIVQLQNRQGVQLQPMLFCGFDSLTMPVQSMLCAHAEHADSSVVICTAKDAASGESGALEKSLRAICAERSVAVAVHELNETCAAQGAQAQAAGELDAQVGELGEQAGESHVQAGEPDVQAGELGTQPGELNTLRDTVFSSAHREALHPTGAVELLQAAGPLAEAELIAQAICDLPDEYTHIGVVTPDTNWAWRELAPKLAARNNHVIGLRSQALSSLEATRVFMGFARCIAELHELEWPQASDEGIQSLGDMSWWPPRAISDFLLSELSGVPQDCAWRLDATYRGNRILSPEMVLQPLHKEKQSSRLCKQVCEALLAGNIETAARCIHKSARAGELPLSSQAQTALRGIVDAARMLKQLGIVASSSHTNNTKALSLSEYVSLIGYVLDNRSNQQPLKLGTQDAQREVRILSYAEASLVAPCQEDVLVLCGLTSDELPLLISEHAHIQLEQAFNLACEATPLEQMHAQMARILAIPKHKLLLEYRVTNHKGRPTNPAVVLIELLARYGASTEEPPAAMPSHSWSEANMSRNSSILGTQQDMEQRLVLEATGVLSPAVRDYVVVPREGHASHAHEAPSLSASQIESYLECPFKWFTLRRLGLSGVDAKFTSNEMGVCVHSVLEQTYSTLLKEAMIRAGIIDADQDFSQDISDELYIAGAKITPERLPQAHNIVHQHFANYIAQLSRRAKKRTSHALVPHTSLEAFQVKTLEQHLHSTLEFDAGILQSFSPRYFELRFGKNKDGDRQTSYAGANFIGTIDRIDVDASGRAVVIDYKHKSPSAFAKEYDAFSEGVPESLKDWQPRRVQALIYAQVVRRAYPQLNVVGALYMATRADRNKNHAIAGALDNSMTSLVLNSDKVDARCRAMEGAGAYSLADMLDACEERVARAIKRMQAGNIEANPIDRKACRYCPVHSCDRRQS